MPHLARSCGSPGARWPPRARWRVATVSCRSSRYARTGRTGAGETTSPRWPHTRRSRSRRAARLGLLLALCSYGLPSSPSPHRHAQNHRPLGHELPTGPHVRRSIRASPKPHMANIWPHPQGAVFPPGTRAPARTRRRLPGLPNQASQRLRHHRARRAWARHLWTAGERRELSRCLRAMRTVRHPGPQRVPAVAIAPHPPSSFRSRASALLPHHRESIRVSVMLHKS
jgi:hypothetical protein